MSDHPPPTSAAFRPPTDSGLAGRDAMSRCPRCGSRLGALAADANERGSLYCACCGLVVPDAR